MSHIERRLNDNAVLHIHRITQMLTRVVPNNYVNGSSMSICVSVKAI